MQPFFGRNEGLFKAFERLSKAALARKPPSHLCDTCRNSATVPGYRMRTRALGDRALSHLFFCKENLVLKKRFLRYSYEKAFFSTMLALKPALTRNQ